MKKCNILVPTGGRSNEALVRPIITRLERQDWCHVDTVELKPGNFIESYKITHKQFHNITHYSGSAMMHIDLSNEYDLVYIVGDRVEMFASSLVAYYNNTPICHYGGGIIEGFSTFDEVHRHNITMMADIELCESYEASSNVWHLWKDIKKITQKQIEEICTKPSMKHCVTVDEEELNKFDIYTVGNVYLDTIDDVDETLVSNELYNLLLYNANKNTPKEFREVEPYLTKDTIVIGGNADPFPNPIHRLVIEKKLNCLKYYDELPRSMILGLMKNCKKYISNSSNTYYEAPKFLRLDQIIMIGERNKNRSTPKKWNQDWCASDRVIDILKKWWLKHEKEK